MIFRVHDLMLRFGIRSGVSLPHSKPFLNSDMPISYFAISGGFGVQSVRD